MIRERAEREKKKKIAGEKIDEICRIPVQIVLVVARIVHGSMFLALLHTWRTKTTPVRGERKKKWRAKMLLRRQSSTPIGVQRCLFLRFHLSPRLQRRAGRAGSRGGDAQHPSLLEREIEKRSAKRKEEMLVRFRFSLLEDKSEEQIFLSRFQFSFVDKKRMQNAFRRQRRERKRRRARRRSSSVDFLSVRHVEGRGSGSSSRS